MYKCETSATINTLFNKRKESIQQVKRIKFQNNIYLRHDKKILKNKKE